MYYLIVMVISLTTGVVSGFSAGPFNDIAACHSASKAIHRDVKKANDERGHPLLGATTNCVEGQSKS